MILSVSGSSTTGIAANLLNRRFLGIEKEENFAAMSKARREEIENINTFATYKNKITDIVKSEDTQIDCFRLAEDLPIIDLPFIANEQIMSNEATNKLEATSGYHVSIALKTKNIPPYLWWYIYDEDNLVSRVYSPSMKSPDNAPEGCSSLQMEVYCKEGEYTETELLDKTVGKLVEQGIIDKSDILFTHIGFEKYANIIFTEPIYEARKVVRGYLSSVGVETIGRFGEWDYLWSDQILMSGLKISAI